MTADVQRRAWIAWAIVCVIWGTTYLAIKVGLETIPPFLMGGFRYAAGGALLALILVARGRSLPARADWTRLLVLGFFMMLLGHGGVVWGEQFVASGLTAVLVATQPFWMVGVESLYADGARLHLRQAAGLGLGFAGIVLLVWPEISHGGVGGRDFALGVLALQVACAGWAFGSAYTRRHVVPRDVLGSAALQMLFGGALMLGVGTLMGEWSHVSLNTRTAAALAYMAVAGSVIAFAAYSYALQHLHVAIVSLYTYVNPIIAVALGTLILGEAFHLRMVLAAAVIVAGVLIVGPAERMKGKRQRSKGKGLDEGLGEGQKAKGKGQNEGRGTEGDRRLALGAGRAGDATPPPDPEDAPTDVGPM